MFEIEIPQRYESWGKLSKWVWRKAMKGVKFSLGSVRRKTHTVKNWRDDEMNCGFKREKAHATWPYFWPVARVVADQNPLRFGTGPLLKVCVDFWGRKTEAENQKPKGKTRKRAIERERKVRLVLLGEINHSSERSAVVKEGKNAYLFLCNVWSAFVFSESW